MSWEVGSEFRDYIRPSLEEYVYFQLQDNDMTGDASLLSRDVALKLLLDQNCHKDDYDEEAILEEFGKWDSWHILDMIAKEVDTMTNGGFNFEIGKGGWTIIPVCSHEYLLSYYA